MNRPPKRPSALDPAVGEMATRFVVSPFTRLARTHALSVAGDTFIALALAGSLFFSISPDAARPKVLGYLLFTMAPFAVVGPVIGPLIDRMAGGRRLVMLVTGVTRFVSAIFMIGNIDSLLLFPLAFVQLVSSKTYSVTKSALVPTTVDSDAELVEANSKLNLLSGVTGFVASLPALPLLALDRPGLVVVLASGAFGAMLVVGARMPPSKIAESAPTAEERAELRTGGVLLAASATALTRGVVGFLTFSVAFWFRRSGTPTWWFGIVLAFSTIGSLGGAIVAPILRRQMREETMLWSVLSLVAVVAAGGALSGGRVSLALLAGAVGFAASAGRLAFDSIVQRDAPDANRGRSFASFETKFQVVWVAAGVVPVALNLPGWLACAIVAGAAAFGAFTYVLGLRHLQRTGQMPVPLRVHAGRAARKVAGTTARTIRDLTGEMSRPAGASLPPPTSQPTPQNPPPDTTQLDR
ncbi:MAG: MFS transporter [Acidimicrobiia bacterium]